MYKAGINIEKNVKELELSSFWSTESSLELFKIFINTVYLQYLHVWYDVGIGMLTKVCLRVSQNSTSHQK